MTTSGSTAATAPSRAHSLGSIGKLGDRATSGEGTHMGWIDEGQASAILVLHPGSSDITSWERVAARLSSWFRVACIRRRLCAVAGPPARSISVSEVVDVFAVAPAGDSALALVGRLSGAVVAWSAHGLHRRRSRRLAVRAASRGDRYPGRGGATAGQSSARRRESRAVAAIHLPDIIQVPKWQIAVSRGAIANAGPPDDDGWLDMSD